MKITSWILVLVIAVIAVGCGETPGPGPQPTPIQTPEPTGTAVPNQGLCKFTGGVGSEGKVWRGDCQESDTCKDNGDGTFSGSDCVARP